MRTVSNADIKNPRLNQMPAKYQLQRSLPAIGGSCQWYAAAVVDNPGNYRDMLEKVYHKYPALQPRYPFMDDKAPKKVRKVKPTGMDRRRIHSVLDGSESQRRDG